VNARLALALGLLLSAASCGGDGVLTDVGGPPPDPGPTLAVVQATVFTPHCALPPCHALPALEQGMNLSAGQTYVSTVGVVATELSGFKRVAPGNAADSYLYMKIAGDPRIAGDRMPFGGTLTAAEIELVRAWIDAGAKNN
jgi:hypothetical protein